MSKKLDLGLRLWEYLPSRDYDQFRHHYRSFRNTARSYISQSSDDDDSLVCDLRRAGCSDDMVSAAAVELMFGGVDTTAHTIIFTLYLLSNNLEAQEKLFNSIKTSNMMNNRYMNDVVKESMRMMPVSPANIRWKVENPKPCEF